MTRRSDFGLAALVLAASFAGIANYILAAEQPARLALADPALLAQWKISYSRGYVVQGGTALIAAILAGLAWWRTKDWRWFIGGAAMLANWPWTLLVLAPINATLMAADTALSDGATRALIENWADLHAVRAALGTAGLVLFVWAAARPAQTGPS